MCLLLGVEYGKIQCPRRGAVVQVGPMKIRLLELDECLTYVPKS